MEEYVIMMSNSSNDSDSDIKNQILSDFVFHRKQAINLSNNGWPWMGLDELRTLLSNVPLSPENYKEADKIIEVIDVIERESNQTTGHTRAKRQWNKTGSKNRNARVMFNRILRQITLILQNEGYFDIIIGKYRNTITPISTLNTETNKPSDKALPERLAEDME